MGVLSTMKSVTAVAVVAALSGVTDAFWRMECHSRTGLARIDPLVEPGEISDHSHAIHGGNNFGLTTTYDDLLASDCTSCLVTQDKSAYWTPPLYFLYPNGSSVVVPQVGGMLAYYLLYTDGDQKIEAFPKGFQMLAGNTRLRNFTGTVPDPPKSDWTADEKTQFALGQKALGFNCLNYAKDPEASLYRHFLPDKSYLDANCADGLRLELMFPSCWNGKDIDSTNHRDHVAYPDLVMTGTCPDGFDQRLPSLFYETIWATNDFVGVEGEFVLSNGDPTGYGYHGDFINGWDIDFLQSAVNTCTNPSGLIGDCALFNIQTQEKAAQCTFQTPDSLKNDNCAGPVEGLPGNVPIQSGPGLASTLKPGSTGGSSAAASSVQVTATSAIVPTLSYKAPTTAVTDSYGGGISIAAVSLQDAVSQPGVLTAAPSVPTSESESHNIVSTTTYTSAGAVYEIAIEEVVVTVTASAPAKKHRRHLHHRRDHEHGLLGRA